MEHNFMDFNATTKYLKEGVLALQMEFACGHGLAKIHTCDNIVNLVKKILHHRGSYTSYD